MKRPRLLIGGVLRFGTEAEPRALDTLRRTRSTPKGVGQTAFYLKGRGQRGEPPPAC